MLFKLAWRHLRGRAWEVAAVLALQMAATIAALAVYLGARLAMSPGA